MVALVTPAAVAVCLLWLSCGCCEPEPAVKVVAVVAAECIAMIKS